MLILYLRYYFGPVLMKQGSLERSDSTILRVFFTDHHCHCHFCRMLDVTTGAPRLHVVIDHQLWKIKEEFHAQWAHPELWWDEYCLVFVCVGGTSSVGLHYDESSALQRPQPVFTGNAFICADECLSYNTWKLSTGWQHRTVRLRASAVRKYGLEFKHPSSF